MPFQMVRNDITTMRVDAIVNAANPALQQGGGVCGAIFARAGIKDMANACAAIGGVGIGQAVLTPGFRLPAKYVIHTAGPVWQGGCKNEEKLLRDCYRSSLTLAAQHHLESVAFPLISAGIFGYPRQEALSIAISEIDGFLMENDMQVYLVIYDRASFRLAKELHASLKAFIDDNYVELRAAPRLAQADREAALSFMREPLAEPRDMVCATIASDLREAVSRVGESFSDRLFHLIDARGLTDPQVYKRANLDRKLFSKIRTKPDYRPSKNTVLALCVALRLDMSETEDLLKRAGLALSPGSKGDLIVEYFIQHGVYNILEINEALFAFDQELLGAKAN